MDKEAELDYARDEGRTERRVNMVQQMISHSKMIDEISDFTGNSNEEIEKMLRRISQRFLHFC